MMLYMKINALSREKKVFSDRCLILDTESLDPATKAAVEFIAEDESSRRSGKILKFKEHFIEGDFESEGKSLESYFKIIGFDLSEYIEDENGDELTRSEVAQIITGSSTAVLIPSGAKQYDIDYMASDNKPIDISKITISSDELDIFGYFVRDVTELENSALMKEGPGTISGGGNLPKYPNGDSHLETSISEEEIRSSVMIFRRMYMKNEPANFNKTVELFSKKIQGFPIGKWVKGIGEEYCTHLATSPQFLPFSNEFSIDFKVKQLIDVFLYTKYIHQPDGKRDRQYRNYLDQVKGRSNILFFLFLTEIWSCSIHILNAGRQIRYFYHQYCALNNLTTDVIASPQSEHPGLGVAEKSNERKERILREKVDELEYVLWKQNGKPEGGPVQFRKDAQEQLNQILNGEEE